MRQSSTSQPTIENPRPDIISDEFFAMLKHAGVVKAFLFGSVLRGEEREGSDIDIFVVFGHDHRLVEQLDLMIKLSRLTGREVDLVTDIHPVFEPYITPTLVPIPV